MKYTQRQVEDIFLDNGLILNDTYQNNCTNLFCVDFDGYKYHTRLSDVLKGKTPKAIHTNNPYVLDNIDLYIKLNNISSQRISDQYVNSKIDMTWQCECGKLFDTTWNEFQSGKHYCNFCAKSRRFDNLKDYTQLIQEECKIRGYELLTECIYRSTDLFEYICNKHADKGIQKATYDSLVNTGRGCYYCGIEARGEKHRLSEEKIKSLVESKGFIYIGYDYDNANNKSKKVNIHIICPKHVDKGVQKVKYDNLKRNTGSCIYCMGYGRTKSDLQKELNDMHAEITILEFTDYASPILVKCNVCGNEWMYKGVYLTQGHGCSCCNQSKFEQLVSRFLDDNEIEWIGQYKYDDCKDINVLPFDFYLPSYNILIEADGEHHYKPINFGGISDDDAERNFIITQLHDKIKNEYCQQHKINLIRIPYWGKNNVNTFLEEKIFQSVYNN